MSDIDPLTGEPLAKSTTLLAGDNKGDSIQSPLDLAAIEGMDAPALRNLIRTCYGVIAGYALLNDEEKAEAARLKLYSLGMTSNEVHKVVPALDKWFDRTAGKAPQSIAMTVKADPVSKLTDDQLAILLANCPNPMVIPPMPKRIEDNS